MSPGFTPAKTALTRIFARTGPAGLTGAAAIGGAGFVGGRGRFLATQCAEGAGDYDNGHGRGDREDDDPFRRRGFAGGCGPTGSSAFLVCAAIGACRPVPDAASNIRAA